jgi:hypothetical protein
MAETLDADLTSKHKEKAMLTGRIPLRGELLSGKRA